MAKCLTVLGIESSCDETAAAVVRLATNREGNEDVSEAKAQTLSNVVFSQTAEHAVYGGVVPELAARAHISQIDGLIKQAMAKADVGFADLDGIAVTSGPGLVGGLLVGMMSAKAIAMAHDLPFVGVNHLEGHALTPGLTQGLYPPYLLLLVSGGHTQIVSVDGEGQYRRLGTTIDDALGEAFDKTAKLLNLGYPGGPAVEKAAKTGDETRFKFPRPLKGRAGCDFSFSGLKTAVRQQAQKLDKINQQDVSDICAGFQRAVVDTVIDRLSGAMEAFGQDHENLKNHSLVVAGGVAANQHLRQGLENVCGDKSFDLIVPPIELCTDNAAMIAYVGALRLAKGDVDALDLSARARWPLDPDGPTVPFAGVKA